MKENLYRSMMEQIQLSDDADRRIRTALEQEVRRKRRHPLGRAGLAAAVAALLITTALGAQLLKSAVFVPHLGPQAGQWEEYVSGDTFAQCQAGRNAISVVSTLFTANSVNLIVEITPWTRLARGALEENMLHCELQIHKPDGTLCVGYDTSFWNHPDTEAAEGLSFSRSVVVLPPETAGTRRLSLSFKTSYTGIAPGDQVTLEFSPGRGSGLLHRHGANRGCKRPGDSHCRQLLGPGHRYASVHPAGLWAGASPGARFCTD